MNNEPRKLAIIGSCAQCPKYIWIRSKTSGRCGHGGQPVQFGYAPIPEWCPLPDAKEEDPCKPQA